MEENRRAEGFVCGLHEERGRPPRRPNLAAGMRRVSRGGG